ncbi:hypothetical protein QR680_004556 [Steinernema hermaphroditum]|uniref:Uncharacterized protein n=1 Tax=Steinernema hermaphroditum TaxID=289476 RepID=A0AA39HRA8_9BILA|nr:hypothetical protein QR680_004556 [Steinernema hermaphroditum]
MMNMNPDFKARKNFLERVVSRVKKTLPLTILTKLGGPIGDFAKREKKRRKPKTVFVRVHSGEVVRVAYDGKRAEEGSTIFKTAREMSLSKPKTLEIYGAKGRDSTLDAQFKCDDELLRMARNASGLRLRNLDGIELIDKLPGAFKSVQIRNVRISSTQMTNFFDRLRTAKQLEHFSFQSKSPEEEVRDSLMALLAQTNWKSIRLSFKTCPPEFVETLVSWWDQSPPSQYQRKLIVKIPMQRKQEAVQCLKTYMSAKDVKRFDELLFKEPKEALSLNLSFIDGADFEDVALDSDNEIEPEEEEDGKEMFREDEVIFDMNHPSGKCARVKKVGTFMELEFC